jgi:hypothetical protein
VETAAEGVDGVGAGEKVSGNGVMSIGVGAGTGTTLGTGAATTIGMSIPPGAGRTDTMSPLGRNIGETGMS